MRRCFLAVLVLAQVFTGPFSFRVVAKEKQRPAKSATRVAELPDQYFRLLNAGVDRAQKRMATLRQAVLGISDGSRSRHSSCS